LLLFLFNFKDGDTALIEASKKGHFEVLKLLIENGGDLNIQNKVKIIVFLILFN
jgi:ankyrin repeat protein